MTVITVTRALSATVDLDGDGRTIVGRVLPYGAPTLVCDPGGEPYTEVWSKGAFRGQLNAANRVPLVWAHDEGTITNQLGHAVTLTESDGGLEGTFRAVGAPGDHALELVRAGMARGLSVHAAITRSRARTDGVIERQAARLIHVALVPTPAYADATVTAIRSQTAGGVWLAEVRARQRELRLRFASSVTASDQ